MSDPINKSQAMPVVREALSIPTDAEQKASIRRLWLTCIAAAAMVFLITGGVVLALFLKGYDSKKVVEVSTAIFQVLMLSYGMGFFVPALITSLRTMALGVRMSRKGLEIGEQTAQVIEKVDKAIDDRLARADNLLNTLDDAVKGIDKGDGPLLKVFRDEMQKLRDEVKAARGSADSELNAALDQGELEAAAGAEIYCPRCGEKMIYTPAAEGTQEGYVCTCVPVDPADLTPS
jgi:hypothetical protein